MIDEFWLHDSYMQSSEVEPGQTGLILDKEDV